MPANTNALDLLDRAPEYSKYAQEYGPFFFGVLLVIVSLILIIGNKNRTMILVFGIPGIALMIFASLLWSRVLINPIYAYTLHLQNLKDNHRLVLVNTIPKLYRHNRVFDTENKRYSVELAAISPIRLEQGHQFKVRITELESLIDEKGETTETPITHDIVIPFKGTVLSVYELQAVSDSDEEDPSFNVVNVRSANENKRFWSLFKYVAKEAFADEIGQNSRKLYDSFDLQDQKSNTIVIYYENQKDQQIINSSLKKYNIKYYRKPSKFPYAGVNSVWVGSDVPVEDVKKIGQALIESGVEMRYFGSFSNVNIKKNVVQIGYSSKHVNNSLVFQDNINAYIKSLEAQRDARKSTIEKEKQVNKILQQKWHYQQQQQQF